MWTFLALAMSSVAQPPADQAPPATVQADDKSPSKPKAGRVYHLRVESDLDCSALTGALREHLADAAEKKCGTIILELSGDRWRPDIARDIAFALRESGMRTLAVLADGRDHRVGAGALAIGLLADELLIERGTMVVATTDQIASDLAPESADLEKATRELSGALHGVLAPHGLESLAWMLVDPAHEVVEKPLYITPTSASSRAGLTDSPPVQPHQAGGKPATPAIRPPVKSDNRGVSIELTADDLTRLDLATPVRGLANVAPGSGTRLSPVSVRASLSEARARAAEQFDAVDRSLAAAESSLKLDWPRDPTVSRDTYQKAGDSAARELDSAAASLALLESMLSEYPELTRTPAPGQTSVAGKPSAYAARWKREAQSRADHLAKLRDKARLFASV
jgi:hypothetical protein